MLKLSDLQFLQVKPEKKAEIEGCFDGFDEARTRSGKRSGRGNEEGDGEAGGAAGPAVR